MTGRKKGTLPSSLTPQQCTHVGAWRASPVSGKTRLTDAFNENRLARQHSMESVHANKIYSIVYKKTALSSTDAAPWLLQHAAPAIKYKFLPGPLVILFIFYRTWMGLLLQLARKKQGQGRTAYNRPSVARCGTESKFEAAKSSRSWPLPSGMRPIIPGKARLRPFFRPKILRPQRPVYFDFLPPLCFDFLAEFPDRLFFSCRHRPRHRHAHCCWPRCDQIRQLFGLKALRSALNLVTSMVFLPSSFSFFPFQVQSRSVEKIQTPAVDKV